jgi:hypothetical protein
MLGAFILTKVHVQMLSKLTVRNDLKSKSADCARAPNASARPFQTSIQPRELMHNREPPSHYPAVRLFLASLPPRAAAVLRLPNQLLWPPNLALSLICATQRAPLCAWSCTTKTMESPLEGRRGCRHRTIAPGDLRLRPSPAWRPATQKRRTTQAPLSVLRSAVCAGCVGEGAEGAMARGGDGGGTTPLFNIADRPPQMADLAQLLNRPPPAAPGTTFSTIVGALP